MSSSTSLLAPNRLAVFSLLVAILVFAQSASYSVEAVRESYKIKPNKVEYLGDALSLLRRFTPSQTDKVKRCERYAILLQDIKSSTQFSIAELGISPERAGYKLRVDVETLRDLYIEAIEELKKGHLDQSLLDLVECLRSKYRAVDKKARSFLNQEEIKTLVDQYKSVVEQPMEILVEDEVRHPDLRIDQLHPAVKQTLTDFYHGDETKVAQHFPAPEAEAEQSTASPAPAPEAEPEPTVSAVAQASAGSVAAGASANQADSSAQAAAQATTEEADAAASASANQAGSSARASAQETSAAALAAADVGGKASTSATAQIERQTDAPSAVPAGETPEESQVDLSNWQESVELSEEEKEFLDDVKSNLIAVFDGLPVEAELPDRCYAYSQITGSDESSLKGPNKAQQIVREITDKLAAKQEAPAVGQEEEESFVPEKDLRDSFLVVLDAWKPEELGEELFIDVLDCVSAWQVVDPDIRVYVQNYLHQFPEETPRVA